MWNRREHSRKNIRSFFSTKDSDSGSGFGLYNCKLFVEDHKGIIGFNTKVGKGTTFFFYLPEAVEETDS